MGDEILKTLLKTVLLLLVAFNIVNAKEALSLGNEVKEYDKIFEKIAERRSGADVILIDKIENPFLTISPDQDTVDSNAVPYVMVYTLEAILDQKAKINGAWYKKNDTVGSYKLIKIMFNSVIIESEIKKKELEIRTKDESNIKIFTK